MNALNIFFADLVHIVRSYTRLSLSTNMLVSILLVLYQPGFCLSIHTLPHVSNTISAHYAGRIYMFWGAILRLCNRVNTRGITSDSVKLISNRQHLLSVTAKVSNQPFKQAGSFTQILFIALSRFTSGSINRYFLLTKVTCRCHQRICTLEL